MLVYSNGNDNFSLHLVNLRDRYAAYVELDEKIDMNRLLYI